MAELDARCPHAWVGNVGTSGYSTVEHGEFLRSACVVHHVDAIVLMVGINDLQRTLMDNLYSEWPGPVWYRSRTAALLRMQVWQRLSGRFLGAILNETDSASSYTLRRRERRAAPIARDVDLEAGLPGYADRLRALVSMCRDLGARPILVTQPVLWKKDLTEREESLLWLGRTRSGSYLSTLDARRGIDLYNGVLRAVARETGVACVDLESMSGCSRFFYDDCHFTERGASRVVELLAGDVRRCLSGASK